MNKKNILRLDKTPLITIAITCFNAEETIERAIKSALNQDWPNFEIIIIDDASKDSSQLIIKRYVSKIQNIKSFNHITNQGCAVSRNKLISKAKGEFLFFTDGDCVTHYNWIREGLEVFQIKKTQTHVCLDLVLVPHKFLTHYVLLTLIMSLRFESCY